MHDRRQLLTGAAALMAGMSLGLPMAAAQTPLPTAQVPGVYRRKVGSLVVTAISDGFVPLDTSVFLGTSQDELKRMLATEGRGTALPTAVNAFVVSDGTRTVLIDTGAGRAALFGPTLGRLAANLKAAGIEPDRVDMVVLTHAHTDHAEGLVDATGTAAFPRAEIVLHEAERALWFDDGAMSRAPDAAKPLFESARKSLTPYAQRTRLLKGGEVISGINLEFAPGHTPGHCVVRVSSGNEQLLLIGDILHNALIHTVAPDTGFAFDIDATQAAASRKRVLGMAATDGLLLAGTHVAFPGFGRVVRSGNAYRFVAADWAYDL